MSRLLAAASLALALATPSLSAAQAPIVGARIGFALPWGDIDGGSSTRDIISSEIPLAIDAGFKLGKAVSLGVYLSYAFGNLAEDMKDLCSGEDCSSSVMRAGLQANLHAEVRNGRDLWGGLFVGYERLGLSGPSELDGSATGVEVGVQGGFDFATSSTGFGPFGSLSVGQFTEFDAGAADGSISDKKFHGTVQLGVRGYFKI